MQDLDTIKKMNKKGYRGKTVLHNPTDEPEVVLYRHVTDGGAVYLTDNHRFTDANVIIRLDGGAELARCEIKV